jgi:hypothetical protein
VRRRGLSLLVAGVFLLGTASACSDDDEGDDPTEEDSGSGSETEGGDDEGGDEEGSGGSDAVEEFCAAVDEAVDSGGADVAALTEESNELISELDPTSDSYDDDLAAIQACVTEIATGAAS